MDITSKESYVIDGYELAASLEAILSPYAIPYRPGLYRPTEMKPVIYAEQRYHLGEVTWPPGTPPYLTGQDLMLSSSVKGNVYDRFGKFVCTATGLRSLRKVEDGLVGRGVLLLESIVDRVITQHGCWNGTRRATRNPLLETLDDVCEDILLPEHYKRAIPGSTPVPTEEYQQIIDSVTLLLDDWRIELDNFLGDDRWIMHFHQRRGSDISVYKTIDFRIYDWMRRTANGEWGNQNQREAATVPVSTPAFPDFRVIDRSTTVSFSIYDILNGVSKQGDVAIEGEHDGTTLHPATARRDG